MESTHDLHSIQAIARNRKSAAFLYPDKDILKEQSAAAQKLHAQEFDSKHFKKLNSVSPLSGELNSAKQSTFAPIQSKTTDEDESVVSSTTNETKIERSTPPGDSTSIFNPRPLLPEELKSYRPPGRPRKATETAAASSTTTLEDDNQRLQMQDTTGRERHKNSNQHDHDTLLGSSKELQPSSTTHEDIVMREKSNNSNSIHQNRGVFLKPTDLPAKSRPMRSTGQPHTLENAVEGGESDAEAARLRQTLRPGVPEQHVKDGRSQFDTRQMHMQLGQNLNRSPILSDVSLIPMSPQQIPGMGGPNQFNPNSSFDLYMSGFSSPTMSVLSQARNLSPRHSIQDLEKINQSFYGSPFNMAQVPTGHQAHMNSFPGGFPSQGMNPLAYYQFLQHQQKLLGMSLEKPDEMGRFPSPLCRSRARKRPLSISPAFSDTLDINAMIRTSPNSLLPYVNGAGLGHSRCSSAASGGSYGHLVSGGISPNGYLSGYNTPNLTSPPLQLLSRQMSMPGYMPGMQQMGSSLEKMDTTMPNPFHHMNMAQRGYSQHSGFPATGKNPNAPLGQNGTETKNRTKNHSDMLNSSMQVNRSTTNNGVPSGTGNDDNEIVYETNCQWENCSKEFDTQEQLVQHINNDHIHGDKKEFACHWKDCAREKRPFKAQYMLVVHMRRHTGEKPHKCTFKDCAKAYSRLENLKTHLRSHTGEKPYVCEFPSCTKAFSNASDRAKHQNRTHSNEKPYVCKITGCTKRYTDPSSLRKHVKTVHGPDAHVTKRMKAIREREEKKSEINVKQEPGLEKEKKKNENEQSKKNCHSKTITSAQHNTDSNPPGSMNPRSNQSSYTSGSDVTPQNSPHMTSQNNDSGVDVNVGGNDADSDGDIIVDENPLPDSTSGGVSVQSRVRADVRPSMISKHFNKKMATLSLAGTPHDIDGMFTDYSRRNVESPLSMNERNSKQGGTEVSSTTLNRKLQRVKNYIMNNSVSKHRHVALINNDRRDSGTVSDVSRKSSSASQYSRKSSQISNAGINVAGSYDPISLDSSRRSSSNSTTAAMKYSGSNSNAPCLNPYDLHHLQSKFSEIAGLPPPTPINGEPYSRQQNFLKPNDDGYHHVPYQQGTNMQNRSNTFLPKPPKEGAKKGEGARRRSEDLYVRSKKTSQPGDSLGPINRRASDPVPKSNQIDPSKLPSIQKHDSWSNMAPLPSIQSHNSNLNDSTSHYNSYAPVQRNMSRSNSSSNFFGNANQSLAAPQQHHQANFDQQMYQPHSGANNQAMMNNMSVDVMPACQPQYHHQSNYVNHLSPAGNMAPQPSKAMSPMSPHRSEMMQLSPMAYQNPAITPPMSHPHLNNQPIKGNHVMLPHPINSYPEHSDQQHYYNNNNMQFASNPMYSNQQMAMHSHMANQQLYEMQQNNFTPQPFNNYNDNHQMNSWNSHAPHMQFHQAQQQNNGMQNHYPNMSHFVPPTSIPDQRPNNMMPNPNPPFTSEETITPRPPSHSSSSTSNRLRITRLRHTNSAQNQPSVIESHPTGSGSYGRPTPRVNCTPDAQIPDDFLEQEFIDSIPELQPDAINSANHNNSYIKMPADSTTGPDGDMGGDIDDAMSTTNTDVTLPPMSAFSSRMATPLMNKPYPPHPMPGSAQHPASNMAISSMSSMLSTLEEENKYLSMMPPQ